MARRAFSQIAGMGVLDDQAEQRFSAQRFGERPGLGLVDPHQWRFQGEAVIHRQPERRLQRADRVVAAIRIAGKIGLAHAADQDADVAAVRDGGREGEEQHVSAGNESIGKTRLLHLDLDVVRHRGRAELLQDAEVQHVVVVEALAPPRKPLSHARQDFLTAFQLHAMALAVVEADGFNRFESFKSPCEAGGRVLPAGKKNQRGAWAARFVHRPLIYL